MKKLFQCPFYLEICKSWDLKYLLVVWLLNKTIDSLIFDFEIAISYYVAYLLKLFSIIKNS